MVKKEWQLTYDLITTDGIEPIEVQFMYFETCVNTVRNLAKHCSIDNIHISMLSHEV